MQYHCDGSNPESVLTIAEHRRELPLIVAILPEKIADRIRETKAPAIRSRVRSASGLRLQYMCSIQILWARHDASSGETLALLAISEIVSTVWCTHRPCVHPVTATVASQGLVRLFADHPRYSFIRQLNSGGFGFVQLCYDSVCGREVRPAPSSATHFTVCPVPPALSENTFQVCLNRASESSDWHARLQLVASAD